MTATYDVPAADAEQLVESEAEATGHHREVTHAALDLLHGAYLEALNTYETLERYRSENHEMRAQLKVLQAENARLRAERGQS